MGDLPEAVSAALAAATGKAFAARATRRVGGGSINQTWLLQGDEQSYFVKTHARGEVLFQAEALALEAIAATGTLRVPRPVAAGSSSGLAFLVLEYLPLQSRGDAVRLGQGLAALHRAASDRYGWAQANFIGRTPQPNGWMTDWVEFWRTRRLGRQIELARGRNNPRLIAAGESLLARLPGLFDGYAPTPSLLHGDLWGGNYGYAAQGEPVIFDPATYYGDREADLAMTELFGGFPAEFYAAYREAWPLDPGYRMRKTLYNLYHVLNHDQMFGGGYGDQALAMMETLLAEFG